MTTPVLEGQASFALRTHNPDVLTCIANLSNDEVFTPPELANQMLDTVAAAWAEAHDGASIWQDSVVTFLDPFTKSGVFLREIVARLTEGLAEQIPDLQERVDHIVTKQVYGIGITQLTALLARRSVYCSKDATGSHSVTKSFDRDWGNIWFERTEHTWAGDRCAYCGAQRGRFTRDDELETHAYAFIHSKSPRALLDAMFGADVQFDVIIGNPPYQMTGAAGGSSDASIYHLFVEQAQRLEPRYLSMVIPARWLAGGRGMDDFRRNTLGDNRVVSLVDYPVASDIFPSSGADFEGGVCYFLWAREGGTGCTVTTIRGGDAQSAERDLDEFDIFVRDPRAAAILRKVVARTESAVSEILTNREPFKFESNFAGYHADERSNDVPIYFTRGGHRGVGYLDRGEVQKNRHLLDTWKVLVPKAYGERGALPAQVLGWPQVAASPSACTGSFLFFHLENEVQARSFESYYATKFFRFLVSLRKITQDAFRHMYVWVPMQAWDRTWTDEALYAKYDLSSDEIGFIDSHIKVMALVSPDV